MNPPPSPPVRPEGIQFARQAAIAALIAPLLAVVVSAANAALGQGSAASPSFKLALGVLCTLFILAGVVFSIIALAGIPAHGTRGILGKSICGLAINGLLVLFLVIGFISGVNRARQSHQTLNDAMASVSDLRSNVQKSFDPEKGITNVDLSQFDRLQTRLGDASQKLTGGDAIVAKAMQAHVSRMTTALQHYEASLKKLTDAAVLSRLNLRDKQELADRGEVVKQFMAANSELKGVITNADRRIEADLVRLQARPDQVRQFMAGFHQKATPVNALTTQIRDCDDRSGQDMLAALGLLEAHWGEWRYNLSADQLRFDDTAVRAAYRKLVAEAQAASTEQIGRQKKLVSLQ